MKLFIANSITADRVILTVLGLVLVGLIGAIGCSHHLAVKPDAPQVARPRPQKEFKPGPRCKILAKVKGKHCFVIIEKNCLKNGVTTVSVAVTNIANGGKTAAEESLDIIFTHLGFLPKLKLIYMGNMKGVPLYLFAVVGASRP